MSGETVDLTTKNIDKLKELFPEIISEGDKIDFDKLKTIMGNAIDDHKERYNFTWHGKKESMLGAQKPSKGTLRPDKEKSKNFDTTENLYIEGDNLETLKLLQKSYNNKVKVIYIDPPYNTGNDFVYKDNFKEGIDNYLEQTGQVDSEGNKLSTNSESQGRYHSNWLNMMYPRLKLARNILADDGVIFIQIGDKEQANLEKIVSEIFGENNLIGSLTRVAKRTSNKGNFFKPTKDNILVYAKNISYLGMFGIEKQYNIKDYKFEDNRGKYKKNGASLYQPSLDSRPNQRYFIEAPDGTLLLPPGSNFPKIKKDGEKIKPTSNADKVWRWSVNTYLNRKNDLIFTKSKQSPLLDEHGNSAQWNIYDKVYLEDTKEATMLPEDIIYDYPNSQGTKELLKLGLNFSFSKPVELIKYLIKLTQFDKDIQILDFFSGSGTTSQAVMELNAEDGGNRKFIMVQLPELLEENSEALKEGYRTICDIGEERIRRAGEKVKNDLIEKNNKEGLLEENQVDPDSLDIGFKVFKLDKSNIKEWNIDFDHLDQLDLYEDIFVEGRSELDVVYEILLKNGIELTYPISTFEVEEKRVYDIAYGNLFICLADNIDTSVAKAIADKRNEYAIETSSVVFKDAGFGGNDSEKLNVIEILKDADYTDDQLLTI